MGVELDHLGGGIELTWKKYTSIHFSVPYLQVQSYSTFQVEEVPPFRWKRYGIYSPGGIRI